MFVHTYVCSHKWLKYVDIFFPTYFVTKPPKNLLASLENSVIN